MVPLFGPPNPFSLSSETVEEDQGFKSTPLIFAEREPNCFYPEEDGVLYQGQDEEKDRITAYVLGLAAEPHKRFKCLLTGRAGTGKTTLARIIAKYIRNARNNQGYPMGQYFEVLPGQVEEREQMIHLMSALAPFDTVFIDEVHALVAIENMFHVLHDSGAPRYPLPDGSWIEVPPSVSFIAATTDPGLLDRYAEGALRRRLAPEIRLNPASVETLVAILKDQDMEVEENAATEIASRAGKLPWQLKLIYHEARNLALISEQSVVSLSHAQEAFRFMKLDKHGLLQQDRDVIRILLSAPYRRKDGVTLYKMAREALCAAAGVDSETYKKQVQPKLMGAGLLTTVGGQCLTEKAITLYGHLKNEA